MTKQIQLPDELYNKIKQDADVSYRTIVGQISYLVGGGGANPETVKPNTESEKIPNKILGNRTKSDIMSDINNLKAEYDDKALECQDGETLTKMKREFNDTNSLLWAEWNAA